MGSVAYISFWLIACNSNDTIPISSPSDGDEQDADDDMEQAEEAVSEHEEGLSEEHDESEEEAIHRNRWGFSTNHPLMTNHLLHIVPPEKRSIY